MVYRINLVTLVDAVSVAFDEMLGSSTRTESQYTYLAFRPVVVGHDLAVDVGPGGGADGRRTMADG